MTQKSTCVRFRVELLEELCDEVRFSMRASRFTESQIVVIFKQSEVGVSVLESLLDEVDIKPDALRMDNALEYASVYLTRWAQRRGIVLMYQLGKLTQNHI